MGTKWIKVTDKIMLADYRVPDSKKLNDYYGINAIRKENVQLFEKYGTMLFAEGYTAGDFEKIIEDNNILNILEKQFSKSLIEEKGWETCNIFVVMNGYDKYSFEQILDKIRDEEYCDCYLFDSLVFNMVKAKDEFHILRLVVNKPKEYQLLNTVLNRNSDIFSVTDIDFRIDANTIFFVSSKA